MPITEGGQAKYVGPEINKPEHDRDLLTAAHHLLPNTVVTVLSIRDQVARVRQGGEQSWLITEVPTSDLEEQESDTE